VVASQLTDRLLADAEAATEDDPDAATLDEIVERVQESYRREADERVDTAVQTSRLEVDAALQRAAEATSRAEEARSAMMGAQLRVANAVRRTTDLLATGLFAIIALAIVAGAGLVALSHPMHGGWLGWLAFGVVLLFVVFETFGVLGHASHLREQFRGRAYDALYRAASEWMGFGLAGASHVATTHVSALAAPPSAQPTIVDASSHPSRTAPGGSTAGTL
jgi:hypothetical protein